MRSWKTVGAKLSQMSLSVLPRFGGQPDKLFYKRSFARSALLYVSTDLG